MDKRKAGFCLAVLVSASLLRGGVESSGELDITVANGFWDCRNHACNVYRAESSAVEIVFAGGSRDRSRALETFDSRWFSRDWSEGRNLNTFPPSGCIITIR